MRNFRPTPADTVYTSAAHALALRGQLAALGSATSTAGGALSGMIRASVTAGVANAVVQERWRRFHPAPTTVAPPASTTSTPAGGSPTPTSPPTTAPPSAPPTTQAPTSTAPSSGTPEPSSGTAGPWNVVFDDEFNGSSLNTADWTPYWFSDGASSNQTTMDSSNVSVSNGMLNLELTPSSGGLVSSNGKFQFTYGYVEARVYLPASGSEIANWPAVWTDGQNWPADGEMDIMEGLGGQACFHFHSDAGGPGSCASGNYTGWHTFGADWEPGSVTYYYDGQDVGSITTGITSSPMYLILENSGGSYGGPSSTPSDMQVDYVRVWQHS